MASRRSDLPKDLPPASPKFDDLGHFTDHASDNTLANQFLSKRKMSVEALIKTAPTFFHTFFIARPDKSSITGVQASQISFPGKQPGNE